MVPLSPHFPPTHTSFPVMEAILCESTPQIRKTLEKFETSPSDLERRNRGSGYR